MESDVPLWTVYLNLAATSALTSSTGHFLSLLWHECKLSPESLLAHVFVDLSLDGDTTWEILEPLGQGI